MVKTGNLGFVGEHLSYRNRNRNQAVYRNNRKDVRRNVGFERERKGST